MVSHRSPDASSGCLSRAAAPSAVSEASASPLAQPRWAPGPGPHSGCPPQDEKERIEALGGFVSHMDCWRVNGTLAVSRAIGKEARGGRPRPLV